MFEKIAAETRGLTENGWLKSWHSFAFNDYWQRDRTGFGPLRVINDDEIAPNGAFPMHPHRDMEIITWVVEGALEHRDSQGNEGLIRAGEAQLMRAGSGILHSEANASDSEALRLLQIWIRPDTLGLAPAYQQVEIDEIDGLYLLAGPKGKECPFHLAQDAYLYVLRWQREETHRLVVAPERGVWLQVVSGRVNLGTKGTLEKGDGCRITAEPELILDAQKGSECLIFDLPI